MDVSDRMQQQARALAAPSRFRMFRYIVEAKRPVGVAELSELLGFNHNAIRQHLAILTSSGFVYEATEDRTVRGRPRKEYTLRADAMNAFGGVSGSYERLAGLLLELVTSGDDAYQVGYRSASVESMDRKDEMTEVASELIRRLAQNGFEPMVAKRSAIELLHCPFADVASKNPGVVCELHRGLIDGYLSAQSPQVASGWKLRDPHRGGCRVTLTRDEVAVTIPTD